MKFIHLILVLTFSISTFMQPLHAIAPAKVKNVEQEKKLQANTKLYKIVFMLILGAFTGISISSILVIKDLQQRITTLTSDIKQLKEELNLFKQSNNQAISDSHISLAKITSQDEPKTLEQQVSLKLFSEEQATLNNALFNEVSPERDVAPEYPTAIPNIQLLLEQGANINAKNQQGRTPLIVATIKHRVSVAQFLIDNGADIKATNDKGETALDLAKRYQEMHFERYSPVVKLLEEAERKLS